MAVKRSASQRGYSAASAFKDPGLRHPTVERAQAIDEDPPYERLVLKLNRMRTKVKTANVAHWFRTKDLRAEDNRALAEASRLAAKSDKSKLLTMFVLNPAELNWHGVGPARRRFMVDNIEALASQLHELGIPFVPLVAESNKDARNKVLEFVQDNKVSHLFANFEYEHDELERDLAIAESLENVAFELRHDQVVVEPGNVANAQGNPMKVFTPFWKRWVPMIEKDAKQYFLTRDSVPSKQSGVDTTDYKKKMESIDWDKLLEIDRNSEHAQRLSKLWPVGHDAAVKRLEKFLKNKVKHYNKLRSVPSEDCTSRMSPYFAMGIISIREALAMAREIANDNRGFGTSSSSGVDSWVRELAFREFYRHMVACIMPHVVMNMPTSLRFVGMETDTNEEGWKRWCEGTTGMPFVDAGMRQLNEEGYMHNRLRMNVSSYLRMNLLIDFRLGLRYFANKLVDWDCCNNAWGWDPNYTVFNPVAQAEKLDPDGEYIRKWVPELREVEGKAIFDPANRLSASEFKKLGGYPKPMIDNDEAKKRSTERLKAASHGETPGSKRVKKEEID